MLDPRKTTSSAALLLSFALCCLTAVSASALDAAKGEIVLTISGEISETNSGDTAEFDVEMLEDIGTVTFQTSTIWTEGIQTFTGVALVDLLNAVGVHGATLRATAINDYAVNIPVSDAEKDGPIVAFKRNGEFMSLRDKGPLWIVYPYDRSTDFQTELIYSRSIWQLDRIEVQR